MPFTLYWEGIQIVENAGFLVSEKEGCFKLTQVKERKRDCNR